MENGIETNVAGSENPAVEKGTGTETTSSSGEINEGGGVQTEEQPKYDVESFNKHFGSSFENESSLKEILDSSSKLSDFESKLLVKDEELKAANEKAMKFDDLVDNFQVEKLYGDEETWKRVELRKQFPDHDSAVIEKIRDPSFQTMSDLEKLVLADKLMIRGNISDDTRTRGILKKLGTDSDDPSELTDADQYAISSALAEKRKVFDDILQFEPDPLKFDYTAEKELREKAQKEKKDDLINKWEPLAKSLLSNYKEAKAYAKNDKGEDVEIFKFAADDKFQEDFASPFMDALLNSGMEPTKDNLQLAGNYLDERFKVMNFNRIVSEAVKHGKSIATEAAHAEINNDKPQNTNEAPATKGGGEELTLKEWMQKRRSEKK